MFFSSAYYKVFSFLLFALVVTSCTKNLPVRSQVSSEKKIDYFGIEPYNNLGLYSAAIGKISKDTIHFTLTDGYPLFYLFPTIHFSGKHIAPAETIAQNFSNAVTYTVTAEDGTTKNYIVLGKTILNHTSKDILFFSFRSIDNAILATDMNGVIRNDSVLVKLPSTTDVHGLVPYVLISGISVSPVNLARQDFSKPLIYKVTAEDGSVKNYLVVVNN